MSIALSTLIPLMNVPRSPQSRMIQALRNASRRFCRDTEVWRVTLDSFNTVVGQEDYTLDSGISDTLFLRAVTVKVDGLTCREDRWSVSEEGVLTFDPAPTHIKPVIVESVLFPTLLCNAVDDFLVNRYGEYIAAGAEFDIKREKGTEMDPNPSYDPEGAMISQQTYREGVVTAKSEIYSSRQSGLKNIQTYGGV